MKIRSLFFIRKPRAYIAGKITGLSISEYTANFKKAKAEVRALGFDPVSPLDLPHAHEGSWAEFMREDLAELLRCDALYAQHNWACSKGASLEVYLAGKIGIEVIYQPYPHHPIQQLNHSTTQQLNK